LKDRKRREREEEEEKRRRKISGATSRFATDDLSEGKGVRIDYIVGVANKARRVVLTFGF